MPFNTNNHISISDKESADTIMFLGQSFTKHQYEEACKNLEEFFKILMKWQKKEGANEKETQS